MRRSLLTKDIERMGQIQGTLEVTIVAGRNLKNCDVIGKNDAYVEVYLNENEKQRTPIVRNTNDPTWNAKFTLYVLSLCSPVDWAVRVALFSNLQKDTDFLYMDVYDKDVISRDTIGSAKIDLKKHISRKGRYEEWISLPGAKDDSKNGEIHVIIEHHVRHPSLHQRVPSVLSCSRESVSKRKRLHRSI